MLFPEIGPGYYDENHNGQDGNRSLKKLMERSYTEGIQQNTVYWAEGDIDSRFEAGDQTAYNEVYSDMPVSRRKQFNFNRIRPVVNMISGHQRNNRKSLIVTPVENADEQTASQFTKIFMWLNQQESVLETISDAFCGSLVTGMNLLQVWVDYRNDPISGSIKVDNCPYNSFLIDPYFRKADLSDCNYIWKRTFLNPAECASLLPDKRNELLGMGSSGTGLSYSGSPKDGKFQFMPENYQFDSSRLFAYDEFYYKTYRKQKMLVDSQTGEVLEWQSEDTDALKQFTTMYPQVEVIESMIPTVNLGIVVQGKVMYDGINPLGIDSYPFVPVFTYYEPQLSSYHLRLQGVVRGLRDPQFLYNRRKVIELDTLESKINSGWIYKENSLVNPKDVYQSGQGRGIALKQDAQMTDVQQIPPPQVDPGVLELSRVMGEEIHKISGISEEALGSATDDKAGILSMLRTQASIASLQGLFDNLDRAQKNLGKIILKVVQNNFTPGKVQRIIEEEPSKEFYNKYFGVYDCQTSLGPNTENQKQMALLQGLHLKESGVPIPDSFFVENMTIQNKSEVLKAMEEEKQQQQQMEQQQQQIQMQELQARADMASSKARADRALATERLSEVSANEAMAVERVAQAQSDRMSGVLDMVKVIKELESVDLGHLKTLVELTQVLKAGELGSKVEVKTEEQQVKAEQNQPLDDGQSGDNRQQNIPQAPTAGGPLGR